MKMQVNHEITARNTHDMCDEEYSIAQLESWSLADFHEVFDACGSFSLEESGNEISVHPS